MYADGNGLYLQVSGAGARSWILRYKVDGRRREMGLGSVSFVTLAQARQKAQDARSKKAGGIDPIAAKAVERAAERAEETKTVTFEDAANAYIRSMKSQWLIADHGVTCSMSRSGNVWDNAAKESFFSSLKTERTARKVYRTCDEARADVFDYIERFNNPKRRHSTIGYLSPMEFEATAALV